MLFDAQEWSAIGTIVSAIATSAAVLVAYFQISKLANQVHLQTQQTKLLEQQIKETHEWNRRKATHEILNNIADGNTRNLLQKMRIDFKCDVPADPISNYNQVLASLPADKQLEFTTTLINIINLFEVVAVSIRHGIIDEDIAYDYLGKVMPAYYFFGQPLIEQRRRGLNFERAIGSLEYCAERWQERLKREQEANEQRRKQKELVKPHPPL